MVNKRKGFGKKSANECLIFSTVLGTKLNSFTLAVS